jgi:hypothetical protein
MRATVVALTLIVSGFVQPLAAAPGVAYTITRRSGDVITQTFNVVASEDRLRVSYLNLPPGEGIMYDVLLRTAAGVTALNSRNGTWYPAPGSSPFALYRPCTNPYPDGKISKLSVKIAPGPAAAGEHAYSGEIRYDFVTYFVGHTVKIGCLGKFTVTTTDRIDRKYWLGRILPETGYGEVDAALREAERQVEGFPVNLSLRRTQTYEGGAPMSDTDDVTASEIREVEVDESEFKRPADYRLQKPVVGFPGVTK